MSRWTFAVVVAWLAFVTGFVGMWLSPNGGLPVVLWSDGSMAYATPTSTDRIDSSVLILGGTQLELRAGEPASDRPPGDYVTVSISSGSATPNWSRRALRCLGVRDDPVWWTYAVDRRVPSAPGTAPGSRRWCYRRDG